MTLIRLLWETLGHYRRTNWAVLLGTMVGSAILTGSLLVGDSMRGTLRAMTLERLGRIDLVHVGTKFFRQDLGKRWEEGASAPGRAAAVMLLQGSAFGPKQRRADEVQIVGTTSTFWEMIDPTLQAGDARAAERAQRVVINRELAEEIGAEAGSRVSLRLEKAQDIPSEGLLGRREETVRSVPFSVDEVIDNRGAGRFSLSMTQRQPMTIFLPIEKLAEAVGQAGRANALVVQLSATGSAAEANDRLREATTLDDLGVSLVAGKNWWTIESRERILSPAIEEGVQRTVEKGTYIAQHVLTYLANAIRSEGKMVPYSVVVGADALTTPPFAMDVAKDAPLDTGGGIVNQWTADRLNLRPGDRLTLDYFQVQDDRSLQEKSLELRATGVVPMNGNAIDRGWTPDFPGITNADTFADWDAPFPVDLDRVKDEDEQYWKEYRTAPKVFLPLADAQKVWSTRFGKLTSVRIARSDWTLPDRDKLARELRGELDPTSLGFRFEEVKARDLSASTGSTDFGVLFLSMSFFLIVSAGILVGLLFRLNTERRASSMGVLLATGWPAWRVRGWLLGEGFVLAAVGSAIGLLGAVVYARLLIQLLSTWWRGAVGTSFVDYHSSPTSFLIGWFASVLVAMAAIHWATGSLVRLPATQLLSSNLAPSVRVRKRGGRISLLVSLVSLAGAGLLVLAGSASWMAPLGAFFGGGTLALVGLLAVWAHRMAQPARPGSTMLVEGSGWKGVVRLGARNGSRFPSRSLLTVALLSLAVFLVVAVGTMRHGKPASEPDRDSGNGGFALLARSTHPLLRSLSDKEGRFALNVSDQADRLLASSQVFGLRLRPGDDASCLNVYQPKDPTILGVPRSLTERGGFAFASLLDPSAEERSNPWKLLERNEEEDVIPAFGDAATLQWILKVPIGGELVTTSEQGKPVRLKIVGTLSKSIFQGQLLIAESRFVQVFPSRMGDRFFLLEPPAGAESDLSQLLEKDLEDFGFDVEPTSRVIEGYLAVQDTYMAAFQTLGGLGLVLGTLGLGAVILRNVLERRGEIALLRAVGFSGWSIGTMIFAETGLLLLGGMAIGVASALLAVVPILTRLQDSEALLPLAGMLGLILLAGGASSLVAIRAAMAEPILPALRSERA